MSYDELEREITRAPATWIPALLIAVVTEAVRKNVFTQNGLLAVVERAMNKVRTHSERGDDSKEAV